MRVPLAAIGELVALLVSVKAPVVEALSIAREKVAVGATLVATPLVAVGVWPVTVGGLLAVVNVQLAGLASATPSAAWAAVRSEERRVGKECRSRGWPRRRDGQAVGCG